MENRFLIVEDNIKKPETREIDDTYFEEMEARLKNCYIKKRIIIKGNLFFKLRVKKAIKLLSKDYREPIELIFPFRHIILSERINLDPGLGILYLKGTLKSSHKIRAKTYNWTAEILSRKNST